MDLLTRPFTIQCGHDFCYCCLHERFLHANSCPVCRTKSLQDPHPAYRVRCSFSLTSVNPDIFAHNLLALFLQDKGKRFYSVGQNHHSYSNCKHVSMCNKAHDLKPLPWKSQTMKARRMSEGAHVRDCFLIPISHAHRYHPLLENMPVLVKTIAFWTSKNFLAVVAFMISTLTANIYILPCIFAEYSRSPLEGARKRRCKADARGRKHAKHDSSSTVRLL